jgi:serine/threonine protein phosphatase 1
LRYAISDIHGCSKTFLALLNQIPFNSANDTLYLLGDYIDRGPDSKGVLDIVMQLPNTVCLKGNHEEFMIDAAFGSNSGISLWIMNGGMQTLNSFNNYIDDKYINFVRSLHSIAKLKDFYLAHAGIRSFDTLNTPEEILLWDRDCKVDLTLTGNRRLICGHTVTPLELIEDSILADKVVIDAGCVFGGNLVALRLDDMKLFV